MSCKGCGDCTGVGCNDAASSKTSTHATQPSSMRRTNPYLPERYTVTEFFRESPDTFTLTVDIGKRHEPGQFVQISIPGIGEAPISIASSAKDHMKFTIREMGTLTKALSKLREGDPVWLRGPYGRGYSMHYFKGDDLLFIGGGCGVAPLKGIIDYVGNNREDYGHVQLILGYRSPNDILFSRELDEWRNKYHVEVTVDKADGQSGESCYTGRTGFVTDVLKERDISSENTVVFVCGPPVMMDAVIGILHEKGFKDDQIFVSAERLMYCAIGICCHCMIKGKYTCLDGPVFRYDEIKEDL